MNDDKINQINDANDKISSFNADTAFEIIKECRAFKSMAWNPHPKVADCRYIARKWGKEQVIILGIDNEGVMEMATYGETKTLCDCAKRLGNTAFDAIEKHIDMTP